MPSQRRQTADKFIVDRSRPHRNSDVARAVRRLRDRLVQQPGSVDFDRELLKLHARATLSSVTAIPLLVLLIAIGGVAAGLNVAAGIWALVMVSGYAVLGLIARRVNAQPVEAIDVRRATRRFLVGHCLSGLGWAYLAVIECGDCNVEQFPVIQAVLLLLAIAGTALIGASLRGVLFATFTLPVAAFVLWGATLSRPVDAIMVGALVVALPFFAYISSFLNQSAAMTLSFRSEKDALIAELETAKSMSDEARLRAEDANLAKSRFLASMSHELRTPLNAILGFSEVMGNEVLGPLSNPTYRDYAHDIHASGQHLLQLINEILDLSRIEAGRYQLKEEPISLLFVVEECCHMMMLKARGKAIRLIEEYEQAMPRLYADERAIRQVALNLLSNALKFTPKGGEIRVRVGWTAGGGQYLSIKDTGPGIPPEEIPVVLSAFGQGSIAIKGAEQGTGLGLPIVQGLMALHEGSFEIHSKLREGTEVLAIFPLSRVMEELPALPMAASQGRRR